MKITPTHAAIRRINAALNGVDMKDERPTSRWVIDAALDDLSDDWRRSEDDDAIESDEEELAVSQEIERIVPLLNLDD